MKHLQHHHAREARGLDGKSMEGDLLVPDWRIWTSQPDGQIRGR